MAMCEVYTNIKEETLFFLRMTHGDGAFGCFFLKSTKVFLGAFF